MATPFPFVSGAVLTAAQLNSISELPTRTITTSDSAAAADSYKRVILNGTSITYTVNTSTFTAGQVVELYNANSTAATIAAGAGVTLNGAAGLTLAQYQTAELYAVSATSFILWKSDVTVSSIGLVYVTGATFTTASSVSLPNNTFTSTYRNYRVILSITANTTDDTVLSMRMRASGTDDANGYYGAMFGVTYAADTFRVQRSNNATSFAMGVIRATTGFDQSYSFDVYAPQVATETNWTGIGWNEILATPNDIAATSFAGVENSTTQFDSLSFIPTAGTITGTYRVYGYSDS